MYPPAEILLVKWTAERFPSSRVAQEAPADLQQVIQDDAWMCRVQRYGGPITGLTLDAASVDLDVFGGDYLTALQGAGEVLNSWILELPGAVIDAGPHGKGVIAKVTCTSGVARRPVTDSTIGRAGASFSIVIHSH